MESNSHDFRLLNSHPKRRASVCRDLEMLQPGRRLPLTNWPMPLSIVFFLALWLLIGTKETSDVGNAMHDQGSPQLKRMSLKSHSGIENRIWARECLPFAISVCDITYYW